MGGDVEPVRGLGEALGFADVFDPYVPGRFVGVRGTAALIVREHLALAAERGAPPEPVLAFSTAY